LLFDEQVTIPEIDQALTRMGFNTKTKAGDSEEEEGRLAFADLEWITEYFRNKYCPDALYGSNSSGTEDGSNRKEPREIEMKMFVPKDLPSLRQVLKEMHSMNKLSGEDSDMWKMDQAIVLVCGGMIVCIDGIDEVSGTICHFVDPHVYEAVDHMPVLTKPGKGGVGNYCVVQLMEDLVQPLLEGLGGAVDGVEVDESVLALQEEIKASALDYISPCFFAITKRTRNL
jgi:hypothetical protein